MRVRIERWSRQLPLKAVWVGLALFLLLTVLTLPPGLRSAPLLLLAMGGGGWWLRRRRAGAMERRRMCCLESLVLRPGSSLHLVEVDGQKLLIGCSPHGLTRLEARGEEP